MKPSEGSYAAGVTAQHSSYIARGCMVLAPAGLSTACCGSSELPEVSRAWLLAACICIASSSTCFSRDEEGKGSVSPGREVPRKKSYTASMAQCLACSMLPGGRGDTAVPSPQLPPHSSPALRVSFLLPVYIRIFLCFQQCGPKLLAAAASVFCSAERQTPACPMGTWLLSALGEWQEARDVFLPPRQIFIPKERRTKWKMFIRNTIKKKLKANN